MEEPTDFLVVVLVISFPLILLSIVIFAQHPYMILLYKFVVHYVNSLRKNNKQQSNLTTTTTITKFDNYMIVEYFDSDDNGDDNGNGKRKVYLPLRADGVLAINECTIRAFYRDHGSLIIKQDPELPIFITASDIGAVYIIVRNNFNGEERKFVGEEKVECFTVD